jgi:hypothetical protein
MTKINFSDKIKNKIIYLWSKIYHKQVRILFPKDMLIKYVNYDWKLPVGYEMINTGENVNFQEWADLLNKDGGFGIWTPERIKAEIFEKQIASDAGRLILYENKIVGCGSTSDASISKAKIGVGMWLFIDPKHRTTANIAMAITLDTLCVFIGKNYDKIYAYTDTDRLSALFLYLKIGAKPSYNSLYSYFLWHKILKRLKPLLNREKRKRND